MFLFSPDKKQYEYVGINWNIGLHGDIQFTHPFTQFILTETFSFSLSATQKKELNYHWNISPNVYQP